MEPGLILRETGVHFFTGVVIPWYVRLTCTNVAAQQCLFPCQEDISGTIVSESLDFRSDNVNLPIVWDCGRLKPGPCMLDNCSPRRGYSSTQFFSIGQLHALSLLMSLLFHGHVHDVLSSFVYIWQR